MVDLLLNPFIYIVAIAVTGIVFFVANIPSNYTIEESIVSYEKKNSFKRYKVYAQYIGQKVVVHKSWRDSQLKEGFKVEACEMIDERLTSEMKKVKELTS